MRCKICGELLSGETAVCCSECGVPYHSDCFEYNGKCAIYGCAGIEHSQFEEFESAELVAIDERTNIPARRTAMPLVQRIVNSDLVCASTMCFILTVLLSNLGFLAQGAIGNVVIGRNPAAYILRYGLGPIVFSLIPAFIVTKFAGVIREKMKSASFVLISFAYATLFYVDAGHRKPLMGVAALAAVIGMFFIYTLLGPRRNWRIGSSLKRLWYSTLVMGSLNYILLHFFCGNYLKEYLLLVATLSTILSMTTFWLPIELTEKLIHSSAKESEKLKVTGNNQLDALPICTANEMS